MVTPDPDHAEPQCAHDELEQLLADHGLDPDTTAELTKAIAEWAKDQDEDWPWDDGTPDPEPTDWSQHPSITDPDWMTNRLAAVMEDQAHLMSRIFREQGNPAAFQAVTHRELGHPVDEHTQALTAHWARQQDTPGSVVPWQPRVRICPERRTRTYRHEPQDWTLWGMPVVLDDRVPPNPGIIIMPRGWGQ